jgi:hypothetical protein
VKSAAKGNQYEKEVVFILEYEGWQVFRQHKKIQGMIMTPKGLFPRMVGADVFGCDIIAKKAGEKTLWIQVSTVDNKSAKEVQVRKFPWTYMYEDPQLWLRIKGKKSFRVFLVGPTESVEIDAKSCPKN